MQIYSKIYHKNFLIITNQDLVICQIFFLSVCGASSRERELSQRDDLIRVLTQTRDQALATLQRHGLAIPTQIPNKEELETLRTRDADSLQDLPPEERIKALEAQNDNLRGFTTDAARHGRP